jgi:hypothetical protein
VESGKLGLFKVNNVIRLGIRSATWSEISFELVKNPVDENDEYFKHLLESVTGTYYFDTEAFLASNGALLTTDESENLARLILLRDNLIQYYYSKFYDHNYHHTFIRPDGIHDPYMLEFWYWLEEPRKNLYIPSRLINHPREMNRSIWFWFRYPDKPIKDPLLKEYCIDIWKNRVWETTINSLINKPYVLIHVNDGKHEMKEYPLCNWKERTDRFGTIEKQYLEDRVADTSLLIEEILTTPEKEPMDMFYETPFLIYVADCVIRKIKYKC